MVAASGSAANSTPSGANARTPMDAGASPVSTAGAADGRAGFQPVVTARIAAAAMALSVVDFIQPPPCRSVDCLRTGCDVKRQCVRPLCPRPFVRIRGATLNPSTAFRADGPTKDEPT